MIRFSARSWGSRCWSRRRAPRGCRRRRWRRHCCRSPCRRRGGPPMTTVSRSRALRSRARWRWRLERCWSTTMRSHSPRRPGRSRRPGRGANGGCAVLSFIPFGLRSLTRTPDWGPTFPCVGSAAVEWVRRPRGPRRVSGCRRRRSGRRCCRSRGRPRWGPAECRRRPAAVAAVAGTGSCCGWSASACGCSWRCASWSSS